MTIPFRDIARLRTATIKKRDIWIYVADFNIAHDGTTLKSTQRIDAEIDDAKFILERGGIVAFLAHKGRFKDGDTEDLDFVLPYLSCRLGKEVGKELLYYPENNTPEAARFVQGLPAQTAAVMGNTRKHAGEEENDRGLSKQFAALGQRAAIGGFGKAHRAHASNVGIQGYIPCYATESQLKEMKLLARWTGASPGVYSVAVLGGVKKEKITIGLGGLARTYDAIIPGGIVLNTILKAKRFEIGASVISDGGKTFQKEVSEVLDGPHADKVLIPDAVIVARKARGQYVSARRLPVKEGVPDGHMIVDYELSAAGVDALDRMVEGNGRLLLAGTPGIYTAGFTSATAPILARMSRLPGRCVALGGDTAAEVGFKGRCSTGGGSALYFVANGTTPVYQALRANRRKF